MKFSEPIFSLGDLHVSDFIEPGQKPRAGKYDLSICIDNRYGAARLTTVTPPDVMYGKYWYRSGTNNTMKNELHSIVDSIFNVHKISPQDVWIDIGCNDGTLLSYVPSSCYRVGVDPADNTFAGESKQHANVIVQDLFSYKAIRKHIKSLPKNHAKVITAIAMFYDLDEPKDFLNDVYKVLDNDGLFVIQMSYTPLMLQQLAFDNICHEHIYYWSLSSIIRLLQKSRFRVEECRLNDVNGGSFRLYIKKANAPQSTYATQPYRDVCKMQIDSLLQLEKKLKVDRPETWEQFYRDIVKLKNRTIDFIQEEKLKGKKICGYGASTKGNTLLQFFGIDYRMLDAIAERSPYKYGLYTVGTNIPIKSEEEVRAMNPDYMLVLPWHFINEFKQREHQYLSNGGKFIVPCPVFELITI